MDARQNFHLRTFTGDPVATPDPGASTYGLDSLYDQRALGAFSDEDSRMTNGLAELELRVGPSHRDVAILAQDLARIHFEDENNRKALYLFERAWRVWRVIEGKAGPNLLMCQQELAMCLHKDGQHMRAEAMYDSAMSGMAEVTLRYAKAADREHRARKAAMKHQRAMDLGGGASRRQKQNASGNVGKRNNETVPPRRRQGETSTSRDKHDMRTATVMHTTATELRPYLTRKTQHLGFTRQKSNKNHTQRVSVTEAVTTAYLVASATTAREKKMKQGEDNSKPVWRGTGGVTQTGGGTKGNDKSVTNPFAYGDGRFVGIHKR